MEASYAKSIQAQLALFIFHMLRSLVMNINLFPAPQALAVTALHRVALRWQRQSEGTMLQVEAVLLPRWKGDTLRLWGGWFYSWRAGLKQAILSAWLLAELMSPLCQQPQAASLQCPEGSTRVPITALLPPLCTAAHPANGARGSSTYRCCKRSSRGEQSK